MTAAGCTSLGAMNLRGTGYVREDWMLVDLIGSLPSGRVVIVPVRVAGLGGFLLSKGTALRNRSKDKDYYDFVYVLLYNRAGGPKEAAEVLRNGVFASRLSGLSTLWMELEARFDHANRHGAVAYARQALQANPGSDASIHRQNAVGAVAEFLDTLRRGGNE